MNKKIFKIVLIAIVLILIIAISIYLILVNVSSEEVTEYIPQEEVTDESLRQTNITLYFVNKEKDEIDSEIRTIDSKILLENPYEVLINLLIAGPKTDNLKSAIPSDVKVYKVELNKEILNIDFSEEFVKNHPGGERDENNTITSILKTVTQLKEVNGIKILIEGKENSSFADGNFNFKEAFMKE